MLLKATNHPGEAEPLYRRALQIDEASLGKDHPTVATDLNNLASLLQDTNRPGEAEPLFRRSLIILLKFTRATGHEHPHLRTASANYRGLLEQLKTDGKTLEEKLSTLGLEAGFSAEEWPALSQKLFPGTSP